jgi:hypothetical protein
MNMADQLRGLGMGLIWGIVFFIVVVCAGFGTPWEAIEHLLVNEGVGEEGAHLLAFVAGFTLPLTLGSGIIIFLVVTGAHRAYDRSWQLAGAAAVLWLAGEASRLFGLGLLPDYTGWDRISGPPLLRPLAVVIMAYFSTYGWALMISAVAIGAGCALQIERWLYSAQQPPHPERPAPG